MSADADLMVTLWHEALGAAMRRVYEALRDNRPGIYVTRREYWLLRSRYRFHPGLREGGGQLLGLNLEILDYELPYDERMRVVPPAWLAEIMTR